MLRAFFSRWFKIEDVQAFWSRLTKQCLGWVAAVQAAYQSMPDEMKTALTTYMTGISVILLILSFIGHNESHKNDPKEDAGKPEAP